jgi:hypothetical protein
MIRNRTKRIGIIAVQPNATSGWRYLVSSNRIEIPLVRPENELHQQKVAYSLADSVVFAQTTNY